MNYVYDDEMGKWLILNDDVVINEFDSEDEAIRYIEERNL